MNTFQLPVAVCQLSGTLLACSLSCIASKPSRRLRSDGNVRWQQQRQLLATLPNRNAMKSIIFPRSVCVACHQPPSTSHPPSSRRLVSTLGQAVPSLNESRRGGKKTQLPTGQWAEALLDLYVLLCKCYKRILITSPDQDRHTDRPRQWDCETERQIDGRLATRCLNSIGATTETEAPDVPSRQDAPDAPPFTMDRSIQQSTMTRPFSLCSAIDIASCEIKRI